MAIRIDGEDIIVEKLPRNECPFWCEKGRVTHEIKINMRAVGEIVTLAEGCEECMCQYAAKLRSAVSAPTAT